ncbi:MAG: hypothetical protein ACYC8T_25095, partial [Myxococcaceae bacterium]
MTPRSLAAASLVFAFFSCDPLPEETPDGGTPVACPAQTGAGTTHSSPAADETWTAEASPHLIASSLTIPVGVTITVDACATVKLGAGADFVVNGKLVTRGTQGRLVQFGRLDSTKAWGHLDATRTQLKPAIDLAWTVIEGGGLASGLDLEQSNMIRVRAGSATTGEAMIRVEQVELRGSSSVGIELSDSATFAPGSTSLTIKGSASEPVLMSGWALTDLPDGDYSGNTVDRLVINPYQRLGVTGAPANIVMHKRNVPY